MNKRCQSLLAVLCAAALLCLPLAGGFAETTEIPQMQPVTFPSGLTYTSPESAEDNYSANDACFGADGLSYHDDSLDIQVHKFRAYDTTITAAFVQIADARQLRTEQARPYPSETTMRANVIAKRVHAVLAINADWFVYHGKGIIYRNGELLCNQPREDFDALAIDVNGDFHIVAPLTAEGFAAIEQPIAQSFAFGPALVIDGEIPELTQRLGTYKQRVAIGQVGPLSYVLVTTDGPDEADSTGVNSVQLAQLMKDLGAINAYNLDGGSSSTFLFDLQKLNTDRPERFRAVGDIIYFVTAIPSAPEE